MKRDCNCWPCRKERGFAAVAPTLAAAHARALRLADAERRRQRWLRNRKHELDRLVAHRELQLVRAYNTGDGRYIDRRRRKLDRAKAARARLEAA